ncbi:MAG: guanylate kinase [Elusimicrobia bacterium RIFOXYD12_FULL_66_9]|nr:MAG: guanylate kinase [Elusimicrobia bacterium RIFOXYD12_FULL_66_9]
MRKGALLIISAPSGAGKTTICRKLLARHKNLRHSVTCTTRAPRPGEKDGKHYFFLAREEFKRRIRRGDFLEWAMVHDEYYGTPRRFVEEALSRGRVVVMTIDVQGAMAVRRKHPASILVFVLPPSLEALRARLAHRREAQDSAAKRLANSRGELAALKHYDYAVVNEDLAKAVSQISSILTAESLRTARLDPSHLVAVTA